jgi:hypothetical protein
MRLKNSSYINKKKAPTPGGSFFMPALQNTESNKLEKAILLRIAFSKVDEKTPVLPPEFSIR